MRVEKESHQGREAWSHSLSARMGPLGIVWGNINGSGHGRAGCRVQSFVLLFLFYCFFLCFSSFEREKKIEIWMGREDGGEEMTKLIKVYCMKFFLIGRKKNAAFLNQDE